jgi:RNA polymerase sigma-70 factor (ECF subfamily)
MVSKALFEQLVLPHMPAAFNLAYWITRSRDEAEDVVQDAYMHAYVAFAQFRGASAKPWLLSIVRNASYRALRTRRRAANVISFSEELKGKDRDRVDAIPTTDPSPEDLMIADVEREHILAALGELSMDHREVIVLRELDGLSYSEIAQAIEAPVGTVMSRLSRARSDLRAALGRRIARDNPSVVRRQPGERGQNTLV